MEHFSTFSKHLNYVKNRYKLILENRQRYKYCSALLKWGITRGIYRFRDQKSTTYYTYLDRCYNTHLRSYTNVHTRTESHSLYNL